jgi:hypothetical protein
MMTSIHPLCIGMCLPVVVMMLATVHMWSVFCVLVHIFHARHQTMHLSAAVFPEISSLPKGTDSCAVDDIRRM